MIGYVIWQSPVDGSALIWCSDHGELAHFDPKHAKEQLNRPLQRNDQVEMELDKAPGLRRVLKIVEVWSDKELGVDISYITDALIGRTAKTTFG